MDAPRRVGKRGQLMASLNALLKTHLRRSANGRKVVSNATIADRAFFFDKMRRDLHALGYTLTDVRHLKPKHVEALMKAWEQAGLSASTLQKRFSYLTLLCRWIGKTSMLRPAASYLNNAAAYQREYTATHDHSWTAQGLDPLEKIREIAADDPAVARVLRLQHAFGLRVQEASLLNPQRDVLANGWLRIVAGTKGGRPRTVPIETDDQRAVLADAAHTVAVTGRSMIPPDYDLKAWLAYLYRVLARHGVTRKAGLVTHGLRHQYANDRYEELTGEPSPVRGGEPLRASDDPQARLEVSARLGHARVAITTAYYGNRRSDVEMSVALSLKERQRQRHLLHIQQQLLAARVRNALEQRQNGRDVLQSSTVALRWRMLNRMLADLAQAGAPLTAPETLNETHIDTLLSLWRDTRRVTALTADRYAQLLGQLCGWLERPDLALRVKATWKVASTAEGRRCPWTEAAIRARIDAIRQGNARVAVHIELVRALGLTHRQAARLQPHLSYTAPHLDVLWETPRNQVLRFSITTDAQRTLLREAQRLLPKTDEAVCPAGMSLSTWLRQVYDQLRQVGGIGLPGAPTLADLKAPDAPVPMRLYRDAYLLERAGFSPVRTASPRR